jgi:Flp pilus assembly protein TadD
MSKSKPFFPILFLVVATVLVFWPVLHSEFINLDDGVYVIDNLIVQRGLTLENVIWAFSDTSAGFYHPLTWLSHMLDCQLFGLNPGAHHLTNLLFHLANTLLLFWVLTRMTGRPGASTFIAALFALHPLHVESVAWVSERKDVLSTFFWILTMALYLRYVEQPGIHRYLLVLLSFTLGLMSKAMLVTLPFVLLLLDYWPLGRFLFKQDSKSSLLPGPGIAHHQGLSLFHLVREKIPLWILSATWCALTFFAEKSLGAIGDLEDIPLGIRLANAISSYGLYLERMIWPRNLAVYYPFPDMIPIGPVIMGGLLLVGLSCIVIRYALSRPYLFVGWFWYLGTLVPVIGLVPVGSHALADRYTYIPLIGPFIMIALGGSDFLMGWRHRKNVLAVSAGLALSFLGVTTRQQVALWHNSITLFDHTLSVTTGNLVIHNNLGCVLKRQGKFQEAAAHYTKALQINPNYAEPYNNLGTVLDQQGKTQEAAAHYTKALQIKPDYAEPHINLGIILIQQGKIQEAAAHFTKALQIKPNNARAYNNMGTLLDQQGKTQEAAAHFTKALQINPNYAEPHIHLGIILARQGKIQEAMAHYTKALQINPDYAEPHNNLGIILARQGKIQEAAAHFTKALQIKPDYAEARNNLKKLLAQRRMSNMAMDPPSRILQKKPDGFEVGNEEIISAKKE